MVPPFLYLALALLCGSANALFIYPASAIKNPDSLIAVVCVSLTPPMEECEFRIRYHDPNEPLKLETPVFKYKPLDGFITRRVIEGRTGRKLFDVKGLGDTNKPNACGIVLKGVQDGRYLIGCRAKNEEIGPSERYMALRVEGTSNEIKSAHKDPTMIQTVAFGNESAAIKLEPEGSSKFSGPCALQGPQKVVQTGPSSVNAAGTVCTLPIRADDTARGVLWASAPANSPAGGNQTELFMKIVTVVGKPKGVNLTLSPQHEGPTEGDTYSYQAGATLTATCTAYEVDTGADIEWTMGGQPLALDGWNVTDKNNLDDWRWPWEARTVEQTISRRFDARDNGTDLKCTVRFQNAHGVVDEIKDSETKLLVQSDVQLCLIGHHYEQCDTEVDREIETNASIKTSYSQLLHLCCLCYVFYVNVKK